MIELAKDVLFCMLLLPFLLVELAVHVMLEALQDWWGNMGAPSPCTSESTYPEISGDCGTISHANPSR